MLSRKVVQNIITKVKSKFWILCVSGMGSIVIDIR